MIIPEKLIGAAAVVLSDNLEERVEFSIFCGVDGLFCGRIKRGGNIADETEKKNTFKKALSALFQLCYNQIGEDER